MSESNLQQSAAAYLDACGWLWFHCPNENHHRNTRLGVKAGVSDIIILEATDQGFGVAIELKSASGRVSPAQQRFLEACEARGMVVGVCRTMDEIIAILRRVRPANKRGLR
jgi:hypothetical protein